MTHRNDAEPHAHEPDSEPQTSRREMALASALLLLVGQLLTPLLAAPFALLGLPASWIYYGQLGQASLTWALVGAGLGLGLTVLMLEALASRPGAAHYVPATKVERLAMLLHIGPTLLVGAIVGYATTSFVVGVAAAVVFFVLTSALVGLVGALLDALKARSQGRPYLTLLLTVGPVFVTPCVFWLAWRTGGAAAIGFSVGAVLGLVAAGVGAVVRWVRRRRRGKHDTWSVGT